MFTTMTNDSDTFAFTMREIVRLEVYRAAIQAGFYTDKLPRARDRELAVRRADALVA